MFVCFGITHFGFWGVFIVLLTMVFSSLTVYHVNLLFLSSDQKYVLSSMFFAFIAMKSWQKVLRIVVTIHEETEDILDEDLYDAIAEGHDEG